jgi:hypothetical protein
MTDTKLQLVFTAKNLAAGEVNRLHGGLVKVKGGLGGVAGGAKRAGGELVGFAKVGVLGAVGALVTLAGAIGYSTKQAADEQVGIVRLDKALRNNAKGYDGNRAAIEKKIAAQEKLGFSDDALRDSLGALVVKTKDVAKAQQLQTVAMDLARARGIDLGTATDVLIKIQNGQYRALKGLGIAIVPVTKNYDHLIATNKNATEAQKKAAKALDDAATKTLALAAIQKATTGQAQAYGDTQVGIFESIKITLGDVVEDLGGLFLPMLKGVSVFARDTVVPALSAVVTTVSTWIKTNQPLIAQVGAFVGGVLKGFIAGVVAVGGAIIRAIPTIMAIGKTVFDFVVPKVQAFVKTMSGPGGVVDSVVGVVGPILDKLLPALGGVVTALFGGGKSRGLVPALGDLVGTLWGNGKGPLAIALTAAGGLLSGFMTVLSTVAGFVADVVDGIDGVTSAVLHMLHVVGSDPKTKGKLPKNTGTGGGGGGARRGARGGPFAANTLMIVGEHNPESAMFATGAGYVIPDGGAAARQRGGGGGDGRPIVVQLVVDGRKLAEVVAKHGYYDLASQAPTASRA